MVQTNTTENSPEVILPPERLDIPKSREIYRGDINDAVIKVQQVTGFEITPDWWLEHVDNFGTTEEILQRFDDAFEHYVQSRLQPAGQEAAEQEHGTNEPKSSAERTPAQSLVSEAAAELDAFSAKFGDHPEVAALRSEFIDALGRHLEEKYNLIEPKMDTEKAAFESSVMAALEERYPEVQRHSQAIEGATIISCGSELSTEHAAIVIGALAKVRIRIGEQAAAKLLEGVNIYVALGVIPGGGQALARENAIILNRDKMNVTLAEMEANLITTEDYGYGDRSRLVQDASKTAALELDLVHELGHWLEYRVHGDYGHALKRMDRAGAPTVYGRSSAREDYAEAWMYYVYGGPIEQRRGKIIEADIAKLTQ